MVVFFQFVKCGVAERKLVWGISNEAFCVWNTNGTFVSSFDPSIALKKLSLGSFQAIAAAGSDHAIVSSTHGGKKNSVEDGKNG